MKNEAGQLAVVLGAWAAQLLTVTINNIDLILAIGVKLLTAIITIIYIVIHWPRFIAIIRIHKRRKKNAKKISK